MHKRILYIGLGGAGQRHLRIIKKILPEAICFAFRARNKTPLLNSDFSVNTNITLEEKYGINIYNDLDEAYLNKPDLVIISTPTSMHYEHIKRASNEGAAIIVEKPGSISYKEAIDLSAILKNNKTKFLVSFQRRFHPYVLELKRQLSEGTLNDIREIMIDVFSHVPSWHPYEDYKSLYACKATLGGGVLLTESHEIDFIIWLFGYPKSIESKLMTKKELDLDVEDSAFIKLNYINFYVNINLNFMSEITKRIMTIKNLDRTIVLDFDSNNHNFNYIDNENRTIDNLSNDSLFENQFKYFLSKNYNSEEYIEALVNNLMLISECKK